MAQPEIRRLTSEDARRIVGCFERVYRGSYSNPLFADASRLAAAIVDGSVLPVGAVTAEGTLIAHMAMTLNDTGGTPELGNTVVDPGARGGGLAWKVGNALISLCREMGFTGFLHYPTTAHDIMQRQSLQNGFVTGLMLGYIAAETDGQVGANRSGMRQAATVVYQPLADSPPRASYVPEAERETLNALSVECGLDREWLAAHAQPDSSTLASVERDSSRRLLRMTIHRTGTDLGSQLAGIGAEDFPCQQVDLVMDDPALEYAHRSIRQAGFVFCGWLPEFRQADVLRFQKVDESQTDMQPALVGETANRLLLQITA